MNNTTENTEKLRIAYQLWAETKGGSVDHWMRVSTVLSTRSQRRFSNSVLVIFLGDFFTDFLINLFCKFEFER